MGGGGLVQLHAALEGESESVRSDEERVNVGQHAALAVRLQQSVLEGLDCSA